MTNIFVKVCLAISNNFNYGNILLQNKSRCLQQWLIGKISQNRKMMSHMSSYVENEAWYEKECFSGWECFSGYVEQLIIIFILKF